MTLLDVPYLPQHEPGGCLTACAAMVLAHLEQPAEMVYAVISGKT